MIFAVFSPAHIAARKPHSTSLTAILAAGFEKIGQHSAGEWSVGDVLLDLCMPMTGRLLKEARAVHNRAAFRVVSGINELANASKADRARTHGARLKRDIEVQSWQPVIAELACGRADGFDLGMCGGIVIQDRLIMAFCDDLARVWIKNHGSDGHFAKVGGAFCERQSALHRIKRVGHLFPIAPLGRKGKPCGL